MQPHLYTVGHGARSLEELVAVLSSVRVTRLVDVRRFPGSRRHPHFGRDALAVSLPAHGLAYDFRGDVFGGRRAPAPLSRHGAWREPAFRGYADHMDTDVFRAALATLIDDATRDTIAIMCAETLWWQCHRRLISDALVARGARVTHLLSATSTQEHALAPDLVRVEGGWPVYDVGCLPNVFARQRT